MQAYVFVLCPPYCGSTVLWKLIATSERASALPDEGQFLPEVRDAMRDRPWDASRRMPWPEIKAAWHRYWDDSKPYLLEKSPPHLIRTAEIREHFDPVRFVVMVRDPYAHVHGLMTRNRWSAAEAARFAVRCLQAQRHNLEHDPDALRLTYEELVDRPEAAARRIEAFLPELGALDARARFRTPTLRGPVERPLVNLNRQKVGLLTRRDVRAINAELEPHRELLAYWGYALYRPSLAHTARHAKARAMRWWEKRRSSGSRW